MDDNAARMAAYIFESKRPALLAVHFAAVDGMQHNYGRDHDSVRLAVAAVDRAIGYILETVKHSSLRDSTVIVIVGDHGFSTFNMVMRPNMLIKNVDARFITAGGSCFLYKRSNSMLDNDIIVKAVTDSLNKLPRNQRRLFRIIDRKALDQMGTDSAALLALSATPGLIFSGALVPAPSTSHGPGTKEQQNPLDGLFYALHGGHHGYDPNEPQMHTGFIAYGAGIRKQNKIALIRAVDIAPLVAELLGLKFDTPDGKVSPDILE